MRPGFCRVLPAASRADPPIHAPTSIARAILAERILYCVPKI
jgi:hypothetical protein